MNDENADKGEFRTLSTIYDGGFLQNCSWLLAVNYFRKKSRL